ncbi:putative acetyltransferase [Marinibacterium anthonyi]|nr:putative acetyltransferase [Marinibacterium anthonyi]
MTLRVPVVTIEPIQAADIGRLSHFSLPPEQSGFADHPSKVLAAGPARDGHVILADGTPAGFFAIDRDYGEKHDFAAPGAIGVRMFSVDHARQGQGIASAACRAMAGYFRAQYPGVATCWLTVNCRNPGARAVYLKGGFVDTGDLYLGGGFGPQHIMRLDLG